MIDALEPEGWAVLTIRTWTVFALCVAAPVAAAQSSADSAMRRLQPLIGAWDVDDTYRSVRGAIIRETGVRTCSYVLENRYVECVTRGRNASGREREYRWMLNYNTETHRYDLIGIFSNYTGKVVQTFRIDSTGYVWNLRAASSSTDDGIEQWHWAQIVFESPDRAVYTSYRNLETNSPTEWTVATRETWIRRPARP